MTALQAYGLDRSKLIDLAGQAVTLKGSTPTMTRVLQDMYWMGELISEWAENPAYLDSEGRPHVIQINGSGISLKSLVQKFFAHRSVQKILEMCIRDRATAGTCPRRRVGSTLASVAWPRA